MAEGPNSFDSDAAVRPDRANATICRLNSGVYRTVLSAIVNSSCYNGEVSAKPGQLQVYFGDPGPFFIGVNTWAQNGFPAPLATLTRSAFDARMK
jgi:hypothetical protein